jgi:hypothetical protein
MGSLEIAREIAHEIILEEAKRAGLASYTQPVTRKTKKRKRQSNDQAAVPGRSVSRRHVNHARKQHKQADGLRSDSGVAARSRKGFH